jgi:hypothetical protein
MSALLPDCDLLSLPERGRDRALQMLCAPVLVVEGVKDAEDGPRLAEREPRHGFRLILGEFPRTAQCDLDLVRELGFGLDTDQQVDLRLVPFCLSEHRVLLVRGTTYVGDHPPHQWRERHD